MDTRRKHGLQTSSTKSDNRFRSRDQIFIGRRTTKDFYSNTHSSNFVSIKHETCRSSLTPNRIETTGKRNALPCPSRRRSQETTFLKRKTKTTKIVYSSPHSSKIISIKHKTCCFSVTKITTDGPGKKNALPKHALSSYLYVFRASRCNMYSENEPSIGEATSFSTHSSQALAILTLDFSGRRHRCLPTERHISFFIASHRLGSQAISQSKKPSCIIHHTTLQVVTCISIETSLSCFIEISKSMATLKNTNNGFVTAS